VTHAKTNLVERGRECVPLSPTGEVSTAEDRVQGDGRGASTHLCRDSAKWLRCGRVATDENRNYVIGEKLATASSATVKRGVTEP